MGFDRGAHDGGEGVGREGFGLGGGGAGERATVGRLRRCRRQPVLGDLLFGDGQALEVDPDTRGVDRGERSDVLGERSEQVHAARVPVGDDQDSQRLAAGGSAQGGGAFAGQAAEPGAGVDRHAVRVGDGHQLRHHARGYVAIVGLSSGAWLTARP